MKKKLLNNFFEVRIGQFEIGISELTFFGPPYDMEHIVKMGIILPELRLGQYRDDFSLF